MSLIEHDVTFDYPAEELFRYMGDPETYPVWQAGFLEAEVVSDGPLGVGAIYNAVHEVAGRRVTVTNEITTYVPNKAFSFKSISGNLAISGDVNLQTVNGGTHARLVFEAQFGGLFRLAEPLAVRLIKRQQQEDLENLKGLLKSAIMEDSSPR
jgi:uncharacterized membrane protein